MADIFGQNSRLGGAFKANLASFTFASNNGNGGLGLLVQNFQSQYAQQVSRVWELGDGNNTYFIVGRSQGDMGMGRIVGPEAVSSSFVAEYADACNVKKNTIRVNPRPGMCDNAGLQNSQRVFNHCILTSMQMMTEAQSMLIQEKVALMFTSLESN